MKQGGFGKIIGIVASAVLVAGAFFAGRKTADAPGGYPYTRDAWLLDTFCTITVYDGGGEEAVQHAAELLSAYDCLFNAGNEESDLYKINQAGETGEKRIRLDPETAEMLSMAKEISEFSEGALWPAIRPVSELWDFKTERKIPEKEALREALCVSKESCWRIEGNDFIGGSSVRIEPGAFAKGYIADRIRESLLESGVKSAIIDLGGNIHTVGRNPDGKPFRIGIKDPKGEESYKEIVEVSGLSVVTAGSYERYFDLDGVRYHHILDPETGFPVQNGLESVTVTGPSSFLCDALATACFVKGTEGGRELIDRYNREYGTNYRGYFLSGSGEMTRTF